MLQEWLALLPHDGGTAWLAIAGILVVAGFALWLAGARCTRMLITLVAVALGGVLGMIGPRLLNWDVNTATTSLSMAMGCGALGFVLTRAFVGVGLVLALALWTSMGVWNLKNEGVRLVMPAGCENARDFCGAMWTGLPEPVRAHLPLAAGAAAIVAVSLTILAPRLAAALLFSLTGVTFCCAGFLWILALRHTDWPGFLPAQASMQALMIMGTVCLGALVQALPMKKRSDARAPRSRPAPAT
ncbi:MAG TPA: hypothetical protein VF669_01610 [Tepidisphaeraceae bacterium]|jgi:hypothetical protein